MNKFKDVFKQLRLKHKLTQEELSLKLSDYGKTKISRSTIGSYEQGTRQPDIETLEMIADYFNVDMNYLMGWVDDDGHWQGDPSTPEDVHGISRRIIKFRNENNLSQSELASKAGISIDLLIKLETNKCRLPLMSDIEKIAQVFAIDPWEIAGFSPIYWDTPVDDVKQDMSDEISRIHLTEIEEAYMKADSKAKKIVRTVLDLEPINNKAYIPDTLAAHNDKDKLSDNDKNDIDRFKKLVQDKKKKK